MVDPEQSVIVMRVPTSLKTAIEDAARLNDRTISQEVRRLLTREFAPKPIESNAQASA